MERDAVLSDCKRYRYNLSRTWAIGDRIATFIMLNPSTADASVDDPTIRRCIGFAERWGMNSLEVVNLFAWRSTDPKMLAVCDDAVGPENHLYLEGAAKRASFIVCAWGAHPFARTRAGEVMDLLKRYTLYCVGTTKDGSPKHPLYAKSIETPILWRAQDVTP